MINIDRRKLLGSLAATTVCAPVASTINAADAAARQDAVHEGGPSGHGWFLARESRQQATSHIVDFWARPLCDIAYTQHLPREIARGAMWYEAFGRTNRPTPETIGRSFQHHGFDWLDQPRRFAAHFGDNEILSSTLQSLIDSERSHSKLRTAFISLDSQGPWKEPGWSDVLPAFRSCYDRVIGHFHVPQRGLRQWRKFLGEEHFQQDVIDAAAQCDAVIVTSAALAECDLWLNSRASTEELVGKLMRHLGCALLTPAVLERIVAVGQHGAVGKPRYFALANLALWTIDDYYNSDFIIRRQADLVQGSFGEGTDERFIVVATAAEDIHSELVNEIRRVAGESFFTAATPAYDVEKSGSSILNELNLITLWPFEL